MAPKQTATLEDHIEQAPRRARAPRSQQPHETGPSHANAENATTVALQAALDAATTGHAEAPLTRDEVVQVVDQCMERHMADLRALLQGANAPQQAPQQAPTRTRATNTQGTAAHTQGTAGRRRGGARQREQRSQATRARPNAAPRNEEVAEVQSVHRPASSASRPTRDRAEPLRDPKAETDLRGELRAIQQRIDFLDQGRVSRADNARRQQVAMATASPFSYVIQGSMFPPKFKMPTIPPYDGTTDPMTHLNNFGTMMRFANADADGIKCLAFPVTLTGSASTWFHNLKPRSINSFADLTLQFSDHFITCQRAKPTAATLFSSRQRENESLRDYVHRFNHLMTKIPGLEVSIATAALIQGSTDESFCASLGRNMPTDIAELRRRQQKYIQGEEVLRAIRARSGKAPAQDNKVEKRKPDDQPQPRSFKNNNQGGQSKQTRFDQYTPLTLTPSQLLLAAEDKQLFTYPLPPSSTSRRRQNTKKFCCFHRTPGHDTDECVHLKNEIEQLIQRGHLREYQAGQGAEDRTEAS